MSATARKERDDKVGPVHDVRQFHKSMRPGKGETAREFAIRQYVWQMEIYSSWAGRDLDQDFDTLPLKVQKQWIASARKRMKELKTKRAANPGSPQT